jgi:hypothetical protein
MPSAVRQSGGRVRSSRSHKVNSRERLGDRWVSTLQLPYTHPGIAQGKLVAIVCDVVLQIFAQRLVSLLASYLECFLGKRNRFVELTRFGVGGAGGPQD